MVQKKKFRPQNPGRCRKGPVCSQSSLEIPSGLSCERPRQRAALPRSWSPSATGFSVLPPKKHGHLHPQSSTPRRREAWLNTGAIGSGPAGPLVLQRCVFWGGSAGELPATLRHQTTAWLPGLIARPFVKKSRAGWPEEGVQEAGRELGSQSKSRALELREGPNNAFAPGKLLEERETFRLKKGLFVS